VPNIRGEFFTLENQRLSKKTAFLYRWTLYRGMVPVLQSLCVSNFVYFYTFHGLKGLFLAKDQNALRDLFFGCVAGICLSP
jgi:hypothetical protein